MEAKKSLLILLRVFFILSTLLFFNNAFYFWDGYSYYMRFIEFLPELSLAFIVWTILSVIFALVLWLIAYGLLKITTNSLIAIRVEHITACLIILLLLIFIKRMFFIPVKTENISHYINVTPLIITFISAALVVWFGRKYAEKVLSRFYTQITPFIWLFALLLVLAIPSSLFTIFKMDPPEATYISDNEPQNRIQPNIILISWDALTARDMSVYGYDRDTTPFISEWAKDAVVFNRAYSASNWTTPSTMSLMTGQNVLTHRVWYSAFYSPVKDYKYNLPKILKENGYNIYGYVQNDYAHPDTLGIGTNFVTKDRTSTFKRSSKYKAIKSLIGFITHRPIFRKFLKTHAFINMEDYFKNLLRKNIKRQNNNREQMKISDQTLNDESGHDLKKTIQNQTSVKKKISGQNPNVMTQRSLRKSFYPPELVYDRFLRHISQNKIKQPIFAWLHLHAPHDPYLPIKPYIGRFGNVNRYPDLKKFSTIGKYRPHEQAKADFMRERYDEYIMYSDEQFRLFMNRLSQSMDLSNTIFIFTSDHGESFAHGYNGHKHNQLYEDYVNIPLIFKMPGNVNSKTIDMSVGIADIPPTILELAGLPVPKWMDGQSLVPLISGKQIDPRPVFATYLVRNRSFGHPLTKGVIAVWDKEYKLIHNIEQKESMLFNLQTDPGETQNLSEVKPDITRNLIKLINNHLVNTNKTISNP